MNPESIYGSHRAALEQVMQDVMDQIEVFRIRMKKKMDADPVEHCLSRIKSEESMREKCRRKGLPETAESALEKIHDAIGIRIVCAFLNDVYMMRDYLQGLEDFELVAEKDYIREVKPNGYRSLHMIMKVKGYFVEFQIRTISMDTWAALEHNVSYKRIIGGNESLIRSELKRCADELASTDVSMQIIRDMIEQEGGWQPRG